MSKLSNIEFLKQDFILSAEEIVSIFAIAIRQLTAEKEYNFDKERHIKMFKKNATDEGCGCEYCKLRYALRKLNILNQRDKKWYEKMWDVLTEEERKEFRQSQAIFKSKVSDVKSYKKNVKLNLGLI